MLEQSSIYRGVFRRVQQERKLADADDPDCSSKLISNLAYAEQRFDSRSRPLFRFFSMFPLHIEVLERVAQMGGHHQKWAKDLLLDCSG